MLRPDLRTLALGALLVATTACGDSRLSHLATGIDRDSVAVVMKTDTPHRSESYLLDGKFWEIFYYAKSGVAQDDSVAWRKLSPVVLADGKVAGWGWDYWGKEAERLNVPVPGAE
jgi:hypothetical protein